MKSHHKNAIQNLKKILETDPRYLAMIICGSLATGTARDDSDIDLYLIATDEEFTMLKMSKEFFYENEEVIEYEGGEVDGKIINLKYLQDAADHGNEPTRASFKDAFIVFSHINGLEALINQIYTYPEKERDTKIKAFYSQVLHNHYYAEQALMTNNEYLKVRSVVDLVYYAVRLTLTHNRILFPCHKSMFDALKGAKEAPKNLQKMSHKLLLDMNLKNLNDYYSLVIEYYNGYEIPESERVGRILENEWTWFTNLPSVSDW